MIRRAPVRAGGRAVFALNKASRGIYNEHHGSGTTIVPAVRIHGVSMNVLLSVCFGLALAFVAGPVLAQPFPPGQGQGQGQGTAPSPQRGVDQPMPRREMPGAPEADRGRMNPDERRQLRRDIQDAGRDIYRPAPSGPPPGHFGRNGRR
jgi:hypothetical protein